MERVHIRGEEITNLEIDNLEIKLTCGNAGAFAFRKTTLFPGFDSTGLSFGTVP
jgi:hypothetical protein